MTRSLLCSDLTRYRQFWGEDKSGSLSRFQEFVESTTECCQRTHRSGHCTGSAFVVSPDFRLALLLYHPFLKRWLQPGGHADGDGDLLRVAHREAHEETGLALEAIEAVEIGGQSRVPLDLDIHPIPERGEEPAHFHYDLRFLFNASPRLPLTQEKPDQPLRWVELEKIQDLTDEWSVLRLAEKVQQLSSSL